MAESELNPAAAEQAPAQPRRRSKPRRRSLWSLPVRNEQGNVAPLLAEIVNALETGPEFEVIFVDDGSTDETPTILANLRGTYPQLRQLRHERSGGQSAAIRSGVRHAAPLYRDARW